MRIPQYEQQVNAPSAPQFNQIVDVRNDNLSGILDGLDKVYQVKLQEQEEAKKTGYIQADTSIRMALDKAAFDLQSKIQNGGSYANAEAEYQKAHDAAIAQFSAAFDADESGNVRARSMAEYQAEGLNNLLKIRDRVTSRRRSDAAGSINLRVAQAQEEYALAGTDPEKKQAAIAKMNSAIAGGSGVGLYSGDEGKLKAMGAIKKAESDRLDLFAQNNADNPQAVLAEIEANQKNLDIDDYISKRGSALADVQKLGVVSSVQSYLENPVSTAKPKQQSIDLYYQDQLSSKFSQGVISADEYEIGAIDLSIKTGKLPSQIESQLSSYLAIDAASISDSDAETTAMTARIVSESVKNNPTLASREMAPDIRKANLLVKRMDAGMSAQSALLGIQKDMGDPETKKIYDSGATEARSILLQKKVNGETFKVKIPKEAYSEFVDSFASNRVSGATKSEALSLAQDEINSKYAEFNGVEIKDPVTKYSNYKESVWVDQATKVYNQLYPNQSLGKGQKLAVVANRQTKVDIQNNVEPAYAVVIAYEDGSTPMPLQDLKTGKFVMIRANKEADKFIETKKYRRFTKQGMQTVKPSTKRVMNAGE